MIRWLHSLRTPPSSDISYVPHRALNEGQAWSGRSHLRLLPLPPQSVLSQCAAAAASGSLFVPFQSEASEQLYPHSAYLPDDWHCFFHRHQQQQQQAEQPQPLQETAASRLQSDPRYCRHPHLLVRGDSAFQAFVSQQPLSSVALVDVRIHRVATMEELLTSSSCSQQQLDRRLAALCREMQLQGREDRLRVEGELVGLPALRLSLHRFEVVRISFIVTVAAAAAALWPSTALSSLPPSSSPSSLPASSPSASHHRLQCWDAAQRQSPLVSPLVGSVDSGSVQFRARYRLTEELSIPVKADGLQDERDAEPQPQRRRSDVEAGTRRVCLSFSLDAETVSVRTDGAEGELTADAADPTTRLLCLPLLLPDATALFTAAYASLPQWPLSAFHAPTLPDCLREFETVKAALRLLSAHCSPDAQRTGGIGPQLQQAKAAALCFSASHLVVDSLQLEYSVSSCRRLCSLELRQSEPLRFPLLDAPLLAPTLQLELFPAPAEPAQAVCLRGLVSSRLEYSNGVSLQLPAVVAELRPRGFNSELSVLLRCLDASSCLRAFELLQLLRPQQPGARSGELLDCGLAGWMQARRRLRAQEAPQQLPLETGIQRCLPAVVLSTQSPVRPSPSRGPARPQRALTGTGKEPQPPPLHLVRCCVVTPLLPALTAAGPITDGPEILQLVLQVDAAAVSVPAPQPQPPAALPARPSYSFTLTADGGEKSVGSGSGSTRLLRVLLSFSQQLMPLADWLAVCGLHAAIGGVPVALLQSVRLSSGSLLVTRDDAGDAVRVVASATAADGREGDGDGAFVLRLQLTQQQPVRCSLCIVRWQQQQLVQAIVRTADGRPGRVEAAALAELRAEQPHLSRLLSSVAHSQLSDCNITMPVTDAMRKAEQQPEDDDEGDDDDDADDGDDTEYEEDEDEDDDGDDEQQLQRAN